MSMHSSQKYIGHVLFEGSSTAKGYGDSAGMGYVGRIEQHYQSYNAHARTNSEQPCRFVYTHMHGQPDRNMPQYVQNLEQHALEARALTYAGVDARLVGVFVVSAYLTALSAKHGEERALLTWRDALERLEDVCGEQEITPILFAPPDPLPGATFANGRPVPADMWRATTQMSYGRVDSLEAQFVDANQILGANKEGYMAEDGLHMNAAGYDLVADALVTSIDGALGVQPAQIAEVPERQVAITQAQMPGMPA